MTSTIRAWRHLFIAGLLCAFTIPAWADADSITISGFLRVPDPAAPEGIRTLEGDFPAEVKFYETSTSTAVLQTVTITEGLDYRTSPPTVISGVLVTEGAFAIDVVPTSNVLALGVVWYSLAFDTAKDGLDPGDLFSERFKINAVPFSLTGKQARFWATHGGHIMKSATSAANQLNLMYVSPFYTPASTVAFNMMSVHFGSFMDQGACSFAIYDRFGKIVAHSGEITNYSGLTAVDLGRTVTLEASTMYYTAWGASAGQGPLMYLANVADVPLNGTVRNVVLNGILPQAFDPDAIWAGNEFPLSITLMKVEEEQARSPVWKKFIQQAHKAPPRKGD